MSEEQYDYTFSFFHVTVIRLHFFCNIYKIRKILKKKLVKTDTDLLTNKENVADQKKLKSYFVFLRRQVLQKHNENNNQNINHHFIIFFYKKLTRFSNILHHLMIYLSLTFSSTGVRSNKTSFQVKI